jgi:membrane protein
MHGRETEAAGASRHDEHTGAVTGLPGKPLDPMVDAEHGRSRLMATETVGEFVQRHLWGRDWRKAPAWRRLGIGAARILVLVARDLNAGQLNMRAMSLVYTTLLSFVPLLALSFSILKGFGVQNRLDDTLNAMLAPLGEQKAAEITENLIAFVNNMNVGVLGAVGLAFLLFTVVSLMQKIEGAFNHVWRIETPRSFGERFSTFLSAITIGPLLIFSAIAITGSVMSTALMTRLHEIVLIGAIMDLVVRLVPFALIIAAFTFLYASVPNTHVRLGAALTGGTVAGVLWESLSFGFANYASGASNYQLVYATFATAIFFMIWLYLNWLILLIGASIAFYRQHPQIVATGLQTVHFSPGQLRRYAMSVLAKVGRRFYAGEPGYAREELAREYGIPENAMSRCVTMLEELGLIVSSDEARGRYVPGVPWDTTTVEEVMGKIDGYRPRRAYAPPRLEEAEVESLDRAVMRARADVLGPLTLKQLTFCEGKLRDRSEARPEGAAAPPAGSGPTRDGC